MSQPETYSKLIKQKEKFTQNIPLILFLSIFFLLVFIIFKDPYISILMIPTYFTIIFIRMHIVSETNSENITIIRSFSRLREIEGGEIEVFLNISNGQPEDTHLIELIDSVPDSFEVIEGSNIFLFNLKGYEDVHLTYKVRARDMGIFEFGNIFLRLTDLFGLVIKTFNYTFEDPEKIIIAPRFERFEKLPIYSFWIKFFSGFFISKQFGQDSDFKGIKEFQNGDKLQHINWKISSRYQNTAMHSLFSNAYSFDSVLEFEIILDLTFENYPIYSENLRITATLAEYLLRTKNRVGLTIIREYPKYIRGKVGSRQYKIIIDELLNTKPDDNPNSALMVQRLLGLSENFSRKAIIFVISSFVNNGSIEYTRKLKERNSNLIAIQPDLFTQQLSNVEKDKRLYEISKNLSLFYNLFAFDLSINSKLTTKQIFSLGIPLIVWNVNKPINGIFQKKIITTT